MLKTVLTSARTNGSSRVSSWQQSDGDCSRTSWPALTRDDRHLCQISERQEAVLEGERLSGRIRSHAELSRQVVRQAGAAHQAGTCCYGS